MDSLAIINQAVLVANLIQLNVQIMTPFMKVSKLINYIVYNFRQIQIQAYNAIIHKV